MKRSRKLKNFEPCHKIFEEIRFARQEPDDGPSHSVPDYDMGAQLQDTMSGEELAAIGADYDEDGNLK